jgi:predicted ATP-dependent protease
VGGINEKIEGHFKVCAAAGLDGSHGALIPQRNRTHLMLESEVIDAVNRGLFHIYTVEHAVDGLELLTGTASGLTMTAGNYAADTVLGRAQANLQAFRQACRAAEDDKPHRRNHRWR